jgi:predicted kinase
MPLIKGKNVVVDNTNISFETRAKWIALAKAENVQVKIDIIIS